MLRRIKCDVENELSEKVSVVHGERTGYYSDCISKPYPFWTNFATWECLLLLNSNNLSS